MNDRFLQSKTVPRSSNVCPATLPPVGVGWVKICWRVPLQVSNMHFLAPLQIATVPDHFAWLFYPLGQFFTFIYKVTTPYHGVMLPLEPHVFPPSSHPDI